MAATHHNMDMGDMGNMDGMDMPHSTGMHMVFRNSMNTPLYSDSWEPNTTGAYAGTIIFLIILGVVFRLLLAGKAITEERWLDTEMKRRYVVVQGKIPVAEQVSTDSLGKKMTLTENGVEEEVIVVQKKTTHLRPWRMSVDPVRAVLDTCIAGVSYLLMLAVMTMNVGYFLAVLAGTFVGSLLVGRFYSAEH
ncbi:Ctr copper transporter [Annulohypoxylon maeteangense]|uniref:Ctr copper transporter n=1 Tax=Annulohypoxylon maeteangense TaxID=1927788 RepID=UPI002007357F|nr:Ctr copper transporter [Annulohypoxylon maeteangense]KAI0885969.1 Ctr copper transporter [Annulohypoxylon maeteangense]